jgi:hypothetical protein
VTVSVTVWVIVGASLAVASLAAIGLFALIVFRALKGLSKEVARAGELVAEAAAPIQAGIASAQAAMARAPAGNGTRPEPSASAGR